MVKAWTCGCATQCSISTCPYHGERARGRAGGAAERGAEGGQHGLRGRRRPGRPGGRRGRALGRRGGGARLCRHRADRGGHCGLTHWGTGWNKSVCHRLGAGFEHLCAERGACYVSPLLGRRVAL